MAPRPPVRGLKGRVRGAAAAAVCVVGLAGQGAAETIVGATFKGPTTRYAHGVLGDAIEFTTLVIETEDWAHRARYRFELDERHVFEDLAPRLWDITGDGAPEVVVIETDMSRGGSLAVYDQTGKIAETEHIGRRNRWLAPVGAADLDGDGRIEVAFVDRPHLAKTLRVFEWDGTRLVPEYDVAGVTNHRIGEDFISGGLRTCAGGPELVLANADWSDVVAVRFGNSGPQVQVLGRFSASNLAAALVCAL